MAMIAPAGPSREFPPRRARYTIACMTRYGTAIGIMVLVLAGCGSKQKSDDGGGPALQQVIAVDWGLEQHSDPGSDAVRTRVSLTLTDETGATTVEPMGEFPGRCSESGTGPGSGADAILSLSCRDGDRGTELRLRRHGDALILLRAPVDPDFPELSFEEAGRVAIPTGAGVRARQ